MGWRRMEGRRGWGRERARKVRYLYQSSPSSRKQSRNGGHRCLEGSGMSAVTGGTQSGHVGGQNGWEGG